MASDPRVTLVKDGDMLGNGISELGTGLNQLV